MHLKLLITIILLSAATSTFGDESTTAHADTTEKPLVVRSVDKEKGLPKETQMAQCTVTSGDIKASAQATFSKKLEGFCSTKDMIDLRENLSEIESRLHDELYNLRMMIRSLLPEGYQQHQPNPPLSRFNEQERYHNSYQDKRREDFRSVNSNRALLRPPQSPQENINTNNYQEVRYEPSSTLRFSLFSEPPTTVRTLDTTTETKTSKVFAKQPEVMNVMRNKLKSLETGKGKHSTAAPETTTATTTETPEMIPSKNEYTYYWKLDNFPKVFRHAKKNEMFSHVFNVKGLFLRIRAVLNHLETENLALDIEHLANVENGGKMEIGISDGLVFKEIAEENLFQFSFAIMDQNRPNHDLISPIYWNTDSDNFLIPNSIHLLANYVKNDSLLIKLLIMF